MDEGEGSEVKILVEVGPRIMSVMGGLVTRSVEAAYAAEGAKGDWIRGNPSEVYPVMNEVEEMSTLERERVAEAACVALRDFIMRSWRVKE